MKPQLGGRKSYIFIDEIAQQLQKQSTFDDKVDACGKLSQNGILINHEQRQNDAGEILHFKNGIEKEVGQDEFRFRREKPGNQN